MAEHQLPKLTVRVRFPSSAPTPKALVTRTFRDQGRNRKSRLPRRRALNVPQVERIAPLQLVDHGVE